jgi:hypothetical protein
MAKRSNTLAELGPKRLEEFLKEAANLRASDPAAVTRFVKRFADFDLHNLRVLLLLQSTSVTHPFYVKDDFAEELVVPYIHSFFRAVWIEPSARTREWALVVFRSDLVARTETSRGEYMSLEDERPIPKEYWMDLKERGMTGVSIDDQGFWLRYGWMGGETPGRIRLPHPPEELPIEKALYHLLKQHKRARHCPNRDCPAPYFFVSRHSQRYCSETCAQSGERETKRRWWAEHGEAWRKKQKQATSQSRRAKKDKIVAQSAGRTASKMTRSRKKGD